MPGHPWREGQDFGQGGLMGSFLVFLETKQLGDFLLAIRNRFDIHTMRERLPRQAVSLIHQPLTESG